jgi:hypothetical protein
MVFLAGHHKKIAIGIFRWSRGNQVYPANFFQMGKQKRGIAENRYNPYIFSGTPGKIQAPIYGFKALYKPPRKNDITKSQRGERENISVSACRSYRHSPTKS